jgi:hypothetical protein
VSSTFLHKAKKSRDERSCRFLATCDLGLFEQYKTKKMFWKNVLEYTFCNKSSSVSNQGKKKVYINVLCNNLIISPG